MKEEKIPYGWSVVVSKYHHVYGFDIGFGWGGGIFAFRIGFFRRSIEIKYKRRGSREEEAK